MIRILHPTHPYTRARQHHQPESTKEGDGNDQERGTVSKHVKGTYRKYSLKDTEKLRKLKHLADFQLGRIGDVIDDHELLLAYLVLI